VGYEYGNSERRNQAEYEPNAYLMAAPLSEG
jgi:hypothetical protein